MQEMPAPIPDVPCCCMVEIDENGEGCQCGISERVLRSGHTLTPAQREWCLCEIGRVEGYNRADHENETDKELGRTVLSAWVDYARDKGLM